MINLKFSLMFLCMFLTSRPDNEDRDVSRAPNTSTSSAVGASSEHSDSMHALEFLKQSEKAKHTSEPHEVSPSHPFTLKHTSKSREVSPSHPSTPVTTSQSGLTPVLNPTLLEKFASYIGPGSPCGPYARHRMQEQVRARTSGKFTLQDIQKKDTSLVKISQHNEWWQFLDSRDCRQSNNIVKFAYECNTPVRTTKQSHAASTSGKAKVKSKPHSN